MNLDEAIQHCEEVADTPCFTDEEAKCYSEHRQLAEWLKELKAYKEQSGDEEYQQILAMPSVSPQTCDDVVSREAVMDIVKRWYPYKAEIEQLKALPSVTPQPKMGHWIFHEPFDNGHKNCNACIECSQCHTWLGHDCYAKTPYCPNCGAKMEVEE